MTKIAIAEDHTLFRETFASFCTQYGFNVVIQAKDGLDLINQLHKEPLPDVIFIDICMPVMDGKQVTELITQTYPAIKVIALSAFLHEKHLIEMLNAGAKGYLTKNTDETKIVDAIECVMTGNHYYP